MCVGVKVATKKKTGQCTHPFLVPLQPFYFLFLLSVINTYKDNNHYTLVKLNKNVVNKINEFNVGIDVVAWHVALWMIKEFIKFVMIIYILD